MLYVLAAICVLISAAVCGIAIRWSDWPRSNRVLAVLAAAFIANQFLLPQFVPLTLQCVLLVGCCAVNRRWPLRHYGAVIIIATLLPYALIGTMGYLTTRDIFARHPFESLEGRLPRRTFEPVRMSAKTLDDYEEVNEIGVGLRDRTLRRLHEDTLAMFVQRFGFGASRMIGFDHLLREKEQRLPTPPQPGSRPTVSAATENELLKPSASPEKPIRQMHSFWFEDFFTPRRFGYFIDRGHVAGFEPHGMNRERVSQREASEVRVRTVDLVGLVLHPEPVVYVSDALPDMEAIATIPRRPLDAFETKGLDALKNGEPLFVREASIGVRVLGPIRAVTQCTKCHGCERGQLLGAFSYVLE